MLRKLSRLLAAQRAKACVGSALLVVCTAAASAQEGYSSWSVAAKSAFIREKTADGSDLSTHPIAAAMLEAIIHHIPPVAGIDLSGANLSGVNLSNTVLRGAGFARAKLVGANLADADLTGADFTGANLTGATLKYAYGLTQAQLDRSCGTPAVLPLGLRSSGKPC